MKTKIKENDLVLISIKEGDENDMFDKTYGIVKKLSEDESIADVCINKKFSYYFGVRYDPEKTTPFATPNLKVIGNDSDPELRAKILFGSFHHLYILPYKFSSENPCMHNHCDKNAHKRILFNIWGSICQYDVCEDHADLDGGRGDGLNIKPKYQAIVKESL